MPYPQRHVLLPHCQTAAFSGFSLDWFSGYQQEEDSFVPAVYPLHEGLGPTWLNTDRRDLRMTANLSGLTWEDTTASERWDSNPYTVDQAGPIPLRLRSVSEELWIATTVIPKQSNVKTIVNSSLLRFIFKGCCKGLLPQQNPGGGRGIEPRLYLLIWRSK